MKKQKSLIAVMFLLLFSTVTQAASVPLSGVDEDELKKVVGDLSTNFLHTSVSGASPLGHVLGFEVGLVASYSRSPNLQTVAQTSDPNAKVENLANAALLGVLTVPLGITGEVGLLPKVNLSGLKTSSFSLAAKWTPTELFGDLPLSLAAKLSHTRNTLNFSHTFTTVPVEYAYENSQTALTLLASKNFAILEPYVGLGYVKATGELSAPGVTGVFASTYTTGNTSSVSRSGTMWMVGTEVKLLIVKFGIEYTNLFEASRFSGKFSFYF